MPAKILVVEDEAIVAMNLRHSLERMGYEVPAVVASGEDAVKAALTTHVDLVLMDIHLRGEMDGIEAASQIRESVDVPVVYLTAYSDQDTLMRSKTSRPFGYIVKPYEERELHAAVEVALHAAGVERDRKLATEALRGRDRLLQDVVDNVGTIVYVTDQEGRYRLVNKGFENVFGVARADAKGKSAVEVVPAAIAKEWFEADLEAIRRGEVMRSEATVPADGDHGARRYICSRVPLRDEDGKVSGVCATLSDITDVRASSEALRDAEARYRLVAENSSEVVALSTPDGVVRFATPTTARLLGYQPEEIVGRPGFDWIVPEDLDAILASTPDLDASSKTAVITFRARAKDGRTVWVESIVRRIVDPMTGAGNVVLSVTRDVSERMQAREEMEHLKRAIERQVMDRAATLAEGGPDVEAFARSVAHDLRGPLRRLRELATMLEEDEGEHLSSIGREQVARIHREALQLSEMVDGMLVLSRVAAEPMLRQPVDITATAQAVVQGLREMDPHRKVEVQIEPGLHASGHPILLRVLLENLLGNAWKYTSARTEARIEFGAKDIEGERVFYIRDNGVGFPASQADRLFTPFQRLDTARGFAGTGIGLTTAQRVVMRHGGRIWGEGEVGVGATFFFTLPSHAARA